MPRKMFDWNSSCYFSVQTDANDAPVVPPWHLIKHFQSVGRYVVTINSQSCRRRGRHRILRARLPQCVRRPWVRGTLAMVSGSSADRWSGSLNTCYLSRDSTDISRQCRHQLHFIASAAAVMAPCPAGWPCRPYTDCQNSEGWSGGHSTATQQAAARPRCIVVRTVVVEC